MRLRTIVASALLLALIGVTTIACSNTKPDRNPYGFIDSRNDP